MGGPTAQARDRTHRPPGGRRRSRSIWRHIGARHRHGSQRGAGWHRLFPTHRELPGKDLRRGQDPRRIFQARGPSDRKGDAHLSPHRPSDPAAVRRRLPQRDADRRHRALPRHGERSRHRRHDRDLGRAHAVRHSFPRPDQRHARRLHRRQIRAEPDDRRDAREHARPRGRRHRRRRADGRVGSKGTRRGRDARRRNVRPEALPAGARRHRQARRACGERAVGAESRYQRRRACGKGPRDCRGRSPRSLQDCGQA